MLEDIKKNSHKGLRSLLNSSDYFDYKLVEGRASYAGFSGSSIVDFSCPFDWREGRLYSSKVWSGATNNGVSLLNIGLTGMDNGQILFDKYRISNAEFLDLLTGSKLDIDEKDKAFFMKPVAGNTQRFNFPLFIHTPDKEEQDCYIGFNGGFFQGFYKLEGYDYQVLPNGVNEDTTMVFVIRPRSDYQEGEDTINARHPENRGIFFFMGTRAENKFWENYGAVSGQTDGMDTGLNESTRNPKGETYAKDEPKQDGYFKDEYGQGEYNGTCGKTPEEEAKPCPDCNNGSTQYADPVFRLYSYNINQNLYCQECDCESGATEETVCKCPASGKCDTYYADDYLFQQCSDSDKAWDEEYLAKDVKINEDDIKDSEGHDLDKKGYYHIDSDNKFLMFDRTPNGVTTSTYEEGMTVRLEGRKDYVEENLFLVANATPTGKTASDIKAERENGTTPYDMYKDIRNNVFALRITEDGAIGYRYGIRDCDAENHYGIAEEYSKEGLIKSDEWNYITVKFVMINAGDGKCNTSPRRMRIMIYVNGFLKLISKELNSLIFKKLNDVDERQETVPYNMSLGGGTLGLLERIVPDYYNVADKVLPIEESYCGSFIGDIKSFKIYPGNMDYSVISNYLSKTEE